MNRLHRWYCQSHRWKRKLENEVLPWSLSGIALGDEVLEVGPGPGLTTDWLRCRCKSITCLEIDLGLASSLARRTANTNISVQCGDATALPYCDHAFSGVVSFTMLHHVPSPALQNRLLAEVYRVLTPGGVFAGTDSMPSLSMRIFHLCDTLVLVDPASLLTRLGVAGFEDIKVDVRMGRFRFFARRPPETQS
jgi:SAM-dependent methyltransferase